MDSGYYREYYYVERNHWWFKARSEILSDYVKNNISKGRPLKILNVGVATGASSEMLMRHGEVSSLEYEQDCIDFIKGKVPIDVIQGSILELPFAKDRFDLVCAFDVLEHVDDHQLAVHELKRVCNGGGSVFITVPAFMSLWGEHDEINRHYRRYSLNSLVAVFQGMNGSIIYSSYFNFFLFPLIYGTRKIANAFRDKKKKLKSDFEKYKPGIIGDLLFLFFKSESGFLVRNIKFPWGVSAMLHWKKNG